MTETKKLKIAIIGAGASGIMSVVKLREIGQADVQVFESASEVGGTWRDNRYPGIACDVPSHLYRLSFAPNAEWSRTCAPGKEILNYIRDVAKDFDVTPHITFNTEVAEALYDQGTWTLKTNTGIYGPFDVLITAMGILRQPTMPKIEGLNNFGGEMFHTRNWRDDISLEGKRVGIIGTGSTSTQIITAIAEKVGTLSVFQRTPQWIMPLPNAHISEAERESYRSDPALLKNKYEQLGHDFNTKFAAAVVGQNPRVYDHMVQMCIQNLENSIEDPILREKLRPNYKVGCKRLVMSDGSFYAAIQKSNVELITEDIVRIESKGVRTNDDRLHELDVLVLATGYNAHSTLFPMCVRGRNGLTIAEAWNDVNEAYLGVTIPEFPNFFMLGGPNSPIGNFSFLMTAEFQCGYIVEMIKYLADSTVVAVSPKPEALRTFNDALQAQMTATVWSSGCQSWYMDRHGNIASWPWTYEHFEEMMSKPDITQFEQFDAKTA